MKMMNEEKIRQALKDSEAYFEKLYPNDTPDNIKITLKDGVKVLAVACEICTLKWVLGKGKLNCYEEK